MKNNYFLKRFVYGLSLICCLGFFSSNTSEEPLDNEVTTSVNITFGRGPSCIGRGLCSAIEASPVSGPGSDASGLMWLATNGHLQLEISKSFISVQQKEQQFINGFFKLIDPYEVPADLSSTMGSSTPITLGAGDYPVQEDSNRYTIEF